MARQLITSEVKGFKTHEGDKDKKKKPVSGSAGKKDKPKKQ
jgi:hypothetical protein